MSKVFCGIDWSEQHNDVALIDAEGQLLAKRRIKETVEGFAELTALFAEVGDTVDQPIPVAIETPRGLLVAVLRASGRPIYAINPMAVARYRERYGASRKKSDHVAAMALGGILRTDAHLHRPLPADTDLARSIAVLARAHQDATWRRTKASNELRSLLREYYPAFLEAFAAGTVTNLATGDARAVLGIAPTPAAAAKLTQARIATALRRSGRKRGADQRAAELHQLLRRPHLRHDELIEHAMGVQALRLLATLNVECDSVDHLGAATAEAFHHHPDHAVITSFPGLGDLTGARVLAEIGDDRNRFADARALKAYAGSAPVTRASGRSTSVTYRRVKNDRLAAAGWIWAFVASTNSPGGALHYRRRRDAGDRHAAALRNLFNRMLGCLHHCLITGQLYDETIAFPNLTNHPQSPAA
ncbi:IS110 family transposase [Actinokineospora sp. HUAS TT18]|uniref:IS110 family transposase n=1 Tax=Actinokineospora sp. HUAS TT18 TaxID=3447451 RepID=UPI003F52051E